MTNPWPNVLKSRKALEPVSPRPFAVPAATWEDRVDLLPRGIFTKMLCLERSRAERAGRRLVLMLIAAPSLLGHGSQIEDVVWALSRATRETDIKGWHREGAVIGVIFTEIPMTEKSVVPILSNKVNHALHAALGPQIGEVELSFHVFPEDSAGDEGGIHGSEDLQPLYPDLLVEIESRRMPLLVKRCLDIVGSLLAILLLAPIMVLIACAIKLTSPGRSFFGRHG